MVNLAGTAGGPMLNILNKNDLCNVLIIVTRYFGGILLGTGGLVRAYSDATTKVIESATLANETLGFEIEVTVNYSDLDLLKYYCKNNNINITNTVFENNIKCFLEVTKDELDKLIDKESSNCKIIEYKVVSTKNIRKKAI